MGLFVGAGTESVGLSWAVELHDNCSIKEGGRLAWCLFIILNYVKAFVLPGIQRVSVQTGIPHAFSPFCSTTVGLPWLYHAQASILLVDDRPGLVDLLPFGISQLQYAVARVLSVFQGAGAGASRFQS